MIVGERKVMPLARHRTVVHMGSGDAFTVWEPIDRWTRIWTRASQRRRFVALHGSRRYCLNPLQIVMCEGKR